MYDFEALLHKVQDQRSEKVEWTQEHMPISVSICSNVPGFEEPHCLVNDNGDELFREMVGYMKDIAEKTELLAKERWGRELGELKHRAKNSVSSMEVCEDEEDKEEDDEAKKIKQLYGKFNAYVSQVPVLGFNSAKYNLNLIKTKLAKHLGLHQEEH